MCVFWNRIISRWPNVRQLIRCLAICELFCKNSAGFLPPIYDCLFRSTNPVILHLISSLTGFLSRPLIRTLVLNTLTTCHDLIIPYVTAMTMNFDPQPNSKWVSSTDFITKVIIIHIVILQVFSFWGQKIHCIIMCRVVYTLALLATASCEDPALCWVSW